MTNSPKLLKLLKLELFPNVFQRIEIDQDLSIGREPENQIVLKDLSISGQHAMIGREGDKVWVEDLGSTNGTLVNDNIIHKKYLEDRDVITIGYCKMLFCIEEESAAQVDVSQLATVNDWEDIWFTIPSQEESIQKFADWMHEKIDGLELPHLQNFSKAIAAGLKNAYLHGHQKDKEKLLRCRVQKTAAHLRITIADQGKGFDYENYLRNLFIQNQEISTGIGVLIKEADSLEFNLSGNQVILAKSLQPGAGNKNKDPKRGDRSATVSKKRMSHLTRHVAIRYFRKMVFQRPSCLKLIFSAQQLRIFPEHLEIKPAGVFGPSVNIEIRPICPGCLVNPPIQQVDILHTPLKVEFWITPLTLAYESSQASIQFVQDGKILQVLKLPSQIANPQLSKRMLWAGLWLPLLFIALDVPMFSINRDLPGILLRFIRFIENMGGWTMFGLLLGCLSVCLGIFLQARSRPIPSEVINLEIAAN